MTSSFCIHYIIYISSAETSSENENKCTDFSQIKIFYAKTPLNCAALFQRFSLGGVLLTSGILSSASYLPCPKPGHQSKEETQAKRKNNSNANNKNRINNCNSSGGSSKLKTNKIRATAITDSNIN